MRWTFLPVIMVIGVISLMSVILLRINNDTTPRNNEYLTAINAALYGMYIRSSVFEDNSTIPARYTCEGMNINPGLIWGEVPSQAKSLALIMEDLDVEKGWSHWHVWNIPPQIEGIPENSIPPGVVGRNSIGRFGYFGPCQQDVTPHRYAFRLYALDTMLNIGRQASKGQILEAMDGHILDTNEIIGIYQRQ